MMKQKNKTQKALTRIWNDEKKQNYETDSLLNDDISTHVKSQSYDNESKEFGFA